jgi:hypothetical protein
MPTIEALKIDVTNRTVEAVTLPATDGLKILHELIGCQTMGGFYLDGCHYCYVDDEGLLGEVKGWFSLPGFSHPIAGNAVVTGSNIRTGADASVKPGLLEQIQNSITFLGADEADVEPDIDVISW